MGMCTLRAVEGYAVMGRAAATHLGLRPVQELEQHSDGPSVDHGSEAVPRTAREAPEGGSCLHGKGLIAAVGSLWSRCCCIPGRAGVSAYHGARPARVSALPYTNSA